MNHDEIICGALYRLCFGVTLQIFGCHLVRNHEVAYFQRLDEIKGRSKVVKNRHGAEVRWAMGRGFMTIG